MKQSKRLLAVLLSMLLVLSTFTIGASAYKTSYDEPKGYDSVLDPYFTNDQAATALMDMLDDKVFAPLDVDESIVGIDIVIHSFDTFCDSLKEIKSSTLYGIASGILNLGDIEDLNTSLLENSANRRRSTTKSDFDIFMVVCNWLAAEDNAQIVAKAIDGRLDLGKIEDWADIKVYEEVPLLKNIHGYVCNMLYELLITDGEPSGYVEGAADSYVLDDIVQNFINNRLASFIFNLLDDETFATINEYVSIPLHKNEAGKYVDKDGNEMGLTGLLPSLTPADISITSTSTYDFIINVFNALIDDIVVPSGGKIILDLLEIDPNDPSGDTSYIDVAINLFVDYATLVEAGAISADMPEDSVNVVEEFLRWKGVENPERPKPIDKTNVALEYILKVGLKKFIHFVGTPGYDSHLQLTEYFSGMLSDLIKSVVPMLPSLIDDITPLTPAQEAAIDEMSNEELFAFLAKMLLETFVDGVYFPDDCNSIKELATYTLINVCEELVHSQDADFQAMIDRGALNPDNIDTCLDIAASVGNYYLVGQTTYEGEKDSQGKVDLTPTFVQLLNGCFETFLGKYVSLFSMYPNASDKQTYKNNPWYKLYMSVNQWIPLTNIIYGCTDSWSGMEDLVMNKIIGNVLNFDINGLLGIIGRRPDSDLNKPLSQLLANLIARILNGVFKLPVESANQKTNTFQLNSLLIPYDYTRLDQILKTKIDSSTAGYKASLNGCGLMNTAYRLCKFLPNITQSGAVASEALDLIAELINVIDLDQFGYFKRKFENEFPRGSSYTMNQLKALYNELKIPDNEGLKYYEEGFTFCHTVDFEGWTYKDFKRALSNAGDLIEKFDSGESVKRTDITYAYFVLDHTYSDLLIPNQPDANNFYLNKLITNNPRITSNDDGNGGLKYTKRTWDAYVKAYDFATQVMNEYATARDEGKLAEYRQSKVNTARQELRDAIRLLKPDNGLGDADYSALEEQIRGISWLRPAVLFTEKSVQNVVNTYNEALAMFRESQEGIPYDADSQEIVDKLTEKLIKVYDNLVEVPILETSADYFVTDEVNSYVFGMTDEGLEGSFYDEAIMEREGLSSFTEYFDYWLGGYPTQMCTNLNFVPTAHGNGTGSVIELQSDNDGDGNFITERKYTVIFFGDVNGDGKKDGTDSVIIKAYTQGLLNETEKTKHITFAGDVDCDNYLSSVDSNMIEKFAVGKIAADDYDNTIVNQAPEVRTSNTVEFTSLVDGVLD